MNAMMSLGKGSGRVKIRLRDNYLVIALQGET